MSNKKSIHVLQPQIDIVSPASASIGDSITVTGLRFGAQQGSGSVSLCWSGGCSYLAVSSWNDTSITAVVPVGVHSGVILITEEGINFSNLVPFTVLNVPTITGSSPEPVMYGAEVTVTGNGFGDPQSSDAYALLYPNSTHPTITYWPDTQIKFQLSPADSAGELFLYVFAHGVMSNQRRIHVQQPQIISVVPNAAAVGSQITITGLRFGATQGSGYVSLGWSGGSILLPIQSWSDTSIAASIPTGAHTGSIKVVQQGINSSNLPAFTVLDSPTLTGVSPGSVMYGGQVTLAGTGFGSQQAADAYVLVYPNYSHPAIVSWSDNHITFQVSSADSGGELVVKVFAHGVLSNQRSFTVLQPQIDTVTPGSAPLGSQIAIGGQRFGGAQGTVEICLPRDATHSPSPTGLTPPSPPPFHPELSRVTCA